MPYAKIVICALSVVVPLSLSFLISTLLGETQRQLTSNEQAPTRLTLQGPAPNAGGFSAWQDHQKRPLAERAPKMRFACGDHYKSCSTDTDCCVEWICTSKQCQ